jgi:hypothetical protein
MVAVPLGAASLFGNTVAPLLPQPGEGAGGGGGGGGGGPAGGAGGGAQPGGAPPPDGGMGYGYGYALPGMPNMAMFAPQGSLLPPGATYNAIPAPISFTSSTSRRF